MKKIKKLLYLLQLEEYDTDRYFMWLKKNDVNRVEERKNVLKWTARIYLIFVLTILLSVFSSREKAVGYANNLIIPLFSFFEEILVLLAKIKLSLYPKLIRIVITGSYGKTTFKEMLAWVLQEKYNVLSTSGNINTRIGITKMILGKLQKKHEILIVEAGAYKKGEIKKICELIKPAIGIITVIGWMHLERFKTIENVRSAKMELADFIKDENNFFYPSSNNEFIDFEKTIKVIGKKLGLKEEEIDERLKSFVTPENRLREKQVNKNLVVIEDNYNSNPLGFEKALQMLAKKYKKWQKIVVTAGMIELGEKQFELNEELAENTVEVADVFIIIGETNKEALTFGAKKAKNKKIQVIWWPKEKNTEGELSSFLRPPTVILKENDFLPDNYF